MKNKPQPASRPKKQTKSPLIKTPAVKAALLGKKKIGSLDNANLHKMERELRETKERLRLLSEAAEEGIAIHDKGIILDANDALARIFGYELSEMIGMKAERLATPETWKVIRKHIATKYNKPYEGVGVRKDGSTFICSLVGKPYKYKGRTLRLSAFHDITERKLAEDKLADERRQLNYILDVTKTRIDIIDSNFNLRYVDDPWQKIYGDPTGRKCYEYFMGRKSPCDNCGIPKALDSRQVVITEEVLTREGNRAIEVHTIPFQNKEGEWLVAEFNIDITERKKAEYALLESEIKYRTLFESASDAIFLLDNDIFIDCNPKALEMFGCTREQLIGQPPYRFSPEVQPDGRKSAEKVLENNEVALRGQPQYFEWKHVRYDGTPFDAEISLNAINDMGKKYYIQAICRDITERKKAEEELKRYREHLEDLVRERTIKLEAANKELEAFSYSASHDLRAPLRSIEGFSQALLEDYEGKLDIQGKDYLIRIRAAIRRMAELIEDLLQLSRITRTEMDMEKVNLTRIARLVIDELQKSQPQRIVDTRIAEGMEETADSKLMRIVLENLLGNAWKFTEKQIKVLIEFGCTKKGERKVYFIRDNGVGFDMDYADKLFAPFQRLHTEEEFPGTGIGLATVRRIIHRHGGKIWTEGQTGKGATFYFSLNEK